jgi:hypothetical protein
MTTRRPSDQPLEPRTHAPKNTSVEQFLSDASRAKVPAERSTHRLLIGLDATASRQPTWDLACELHAELFTEAARAGNIAIQLCYYRGLNEFVASRWATTPSQLRDHMVSVSCRGGRTQICKLLAHALREAINHPVRALVFVGDCFEEDERETTRLAGQLALRALPVFIFQEHSDRRAARAFASIAQITGGAHIPFDSHSPDELRRLLRAMAQFATGGRLALEQYSSRFGNTQTRALLSQLKPS